jgi:hypothetical protein
VKKLQNCSSVVLVLLRRLWGNHFAVLQNGTGGGIRGRCPSATASKWKNDTSGYIFRIDCWEAEKNLKTTPGSDCALNALAIDEPLEYAKLYLDGNLQMWVDAEDSLDIF